MLLDLKLSFEHLIKLNRYSGMAKGSKKEGLQAQNKRKSFFQKDCQTPPDMGCGTTEAANLVSLISTLSRFLMYSSIRVSSKLNPNLQATSNDVKVVRRYGIPAI